MPFFWGSVWSSRSETVADHATMIQTPDSEARAEGETLRTIRLFLLVLVMIGSLGFLVELFLLEHTESATQLIPFVVLVAGLVGGVAVGFRPTRATVRFFQGTMAAFVVSGLVGLYLHYSGNVQFEREMDASAAGLALVWESLRGATPALAPGALVQLGLLGLIQAYRHPAIGGGPR